MCTVLRWLVLGLTLVSLATPAQAQFERGPLYAGEGNFRFFGCRAEVGCITTVAHLRRIDFVEDGVMHPYWSLHADSQVECLILIGWGCYLQNLELWDQYGLSLRVFAQGSDLGDVPGPQSIPYRGEAVLYWHDPVTGDLSFRDLVPLTLMPVEADVMALTTVTPEPATWLLMASGLIGLALVTWWQRRHAEVRA